jgi:hypothetical protein
LRLSGNEAKEDHERGHDEPSGEGAGGVVEGGKEGAFMGEEMRFIVGIPVRDVEINRSLIPRRQRPINFLYFFRGEGRFGAWHGTPSRINGPKSGRQRNREFRSKL